MPCSIRILPALSAMACAIVGGACWAIGNLVAPLAWTPAWRAALGWGFAIAGALICGLAGLRLGRVIANKLERTRQALQDIEQGGPSGPLAESWPQELAQVACQCNNLAESLGRSRNAWRDMLANIAHDLRTPLGSLGAAIEALQAGADQDQLVRARLYAGIEQQLHFMDTMTYDLLRLAHYRSGQLELRRTPVNLATLVEKVGWAYEAEAQQKNLDVTTDLHLAPATVLADEDRITEVLINLWDNAIKFTPQDGQIRVQIDIVDNGSAAHVRFESSSPAIAEQNLSRLFERFYRFPGVEDRGLGLGLAIVKELVEAHGGAVWAEPGRELSGPTLAFSLPLAIQLGAAT